MRRNPAYSYLLSQQNEENFAGQKLILKQGYPLI
jgi:hypothetical protein